LEKEARRSHERVYQSRQSGVDDRKMKANPEEVHGFNTDTMCSIVTAKRAFFQNRLIVLRKNPTGCKLLCEYQKLLSTTAPDPDERSIA
jgi:hypothetical protein